jgi:hypothetical protein
MHYSTPLRNRRPETHTQTLASGGGEPLDWVHGVLPEAAPTFGWLETALDNLALVATNDTAILQQLTAANLALTTTVATLTATNKKLVDAAARAKGGGTPSVTPTNPSRRVQGTRTPFPGNYCWMHGHCCNKHHTSATCGNKAVGHCNDATALNTMQHTGQRLGHSAHLTGGDGEFSLLR